MLWHFTALWRLYPRLILVRGAPQVVIIGQIRIKQTYFSSNQSTFYDCCCFVDSSVQWSQWSSCSKSCGFGVQEQDVICHGMECDKMLPSVTRACQISSCSVHNMAENNFQGLLHKSKTDLALANHNLKELLVSSAIECALFCLRIPQCSSINIAIEKDLAHGLFVCQLNNATIDSVPKDLIRSNGFNYYNIISRHLGDWGTCRFSPFLASVTSTVITSNQDNLEFEECGKPPHVTLKAAH